MIDSGIEQLRSMKFMVAQEYKFELKNDLSELKALNQHLNNWAEDINLPAISISRINICLDELFTNIVSYSFEDDLEHNLRMFSSLSKAVRVPEADRSGLS